MDGIEALKLLINLTNKYIELEDKLKEKQQELDVLKEEFKGLKEDLNKLSTMYKIQKEEIKKENKFVLIKNTGDIIECERLTDLVDMDGFDRVEIVKVNGDKLNILKRYIEVFDKKEDAEERRKNFVL